MTVSGGHGGTSRSNVSGEVLRNDGILMGLPNPTPSPLADWLAAKLERKEQTPKPVTYFDGTIVAHGTLTGYHYHRKRKQTPCDDCRDAWAAYCRQWRKRKPGYYSGRST